MSAGGPILVTGAAGFIGFHIAHRLLRIGNHIVGVDNLNGYYDPALKRARLEQLKPFANFQFEQVDIADRKRTGELFAAHEFPFVAHLAAQPGVRHSLADPHSYADANIIGFLNVLEGGRRNGCQHLVYASSSSVYGGNNAPFSTAQNVDHPLNLYGATKKANELIAHAYAHLFGLRATGLRFFTVYGPWGRPDMAGWLFTEAILQGMPSGCQPAGWRRYQRACPLTVRDLPDVEIAVERANPRSATLNRSDAARPGARAPQHLSRRSEPRFMARGAFGPPRRCHCRASGLAASRHRNRLGDGAPLADWAPRADARWPRIAEKV